MCPHELRSQCLLLAASRLHSHICRADFAIKGDFQHRLGAFTSSDSRLKLVGLDLDKTTSAEGVATPEDATMSYLTGISFKPAWGVGPMSAFISRIAAPVRDAVIPSVTTERWRVLLPEHTFVNNVDALVSVHFASTTATAPTVTKRRQVGAHHPGDASHM